MSSSAGHQAVTMCHVFLLLQKLVVDVAIVTSFRQADLPWARRFDVASPRFIGRRSASTVLSQDCLGRPILRLQSSGGQEDPKCKPVEHGNGLVRGRCGADGQRRTDDNCERCRTGLSALYKSVSHHWWRILTNGHWESVWGTKCPVHRSSLIISQSPTMSQRHIGISAEYTCLACKKSFLNNSHKFTFSLTWSNL